ncbi:MAG: fumarylacetoacetase [Aestuariivita sp.]|nr:fumarylacetoacetase [Aestuariivita sp.]
MNDLKLSWIASANSAETLFPLNNLPYGVFSTNGKRPHCGVAIGNFILDVTLAEESGLLTICSEPLFKAASWNKLMSQSPNVWTTFRTRLMEILAEDSSDQARAEAFLISSADVQLHMPFTVSEYTDFYAGRHHALNVGMMFRGPENALPPNWLHIPIGYNGRASSIVVSGTNIRRPWSQLKSPDDTDPRFGPSARFDIELEIGAVVGVPSNGPITVSQADDNIFGYVLLNDWSARDIQAWEYQPLGPFQSKATATSISPWIVTKAALDPFRCETPEREKELLPHLRDCGPMLYDINLSVSLIPDNGLETEIAHTNYNVMYYSAAQQLAHHTTSGCPMRTGDLLGSGTISGPRKDNRGSLLELSWGGKEPFELIDGSSRSFLEDGDTIVLKGSANGHGYKVGFGDCVGKIIEAVNDLE